MSCEPFFYLLIVRFVVQPDAFSLLLLASQGAEWYDFEFTGEAAVLNRELNVVKSCGRAIIACRLDAIRKRAAGLSVHPEEDVLKDRMHAETKELIGEALAAAEKVFFSPAVESTQAILPIAVPRCHFVGAFPHHPAITLRSAGFADIVARAAAGRRPRVCRRAVDAEDARRGVPAGAPGAGGHAGSDPRTPRYD